MTHDTFVPLVDEIEVPVTRDTLVPHVVGTEAPVACDTLVPPVDGTEAPVAHVTLVPRMDRTEVPVAPDTLVPLVEAPVARYTFVHPADETPNNIMPRKSVDSAHASMLQGAKATLGHHTNVHAGGEPPLAGNTLTLSFQVVDIPQDLVPMQSVSGTHLSVAETVSMNQPLSSERKDIEKLPMSCPVVFDSDDSSDTDFIPPKFKAQKRKHNICSKYALLVNECPTSLKSILPQSTEYSYIIEEFTESEPLNDTSDFEATVCINISDKQQAGKLLQDFMNCSKCTYRVTKTTNPAMKCIWQNM